MKKDNSIWILEDFEGCRFVYHKVLDHRFETRYFSQLEDFRQALILTQERPDLIVADLSLQDGSFFDILSHPEEQNLLNVPFIVVSSMCDSDALRFCYRKGAIDYLVKPFKKAELLVKVEQALLKKCSFRGVSDLLYSENLTKKERQIVQVLYDAKGASVSREKLLNIIWKKENVAPKTVDVHIHNIRKKVASNSVQIAADGLNGWVLQIEE